MHAIKLELERVIDQPDDAKVHVQWWYPGITEFIKSSTNLETRESATAPPPRLSIASKLFSEADGKLEKDQRLQASITSSNVEEYIQKDEKDHLLLSSVDTAVPVVALEEPAGEEEFPFVSQQKSTPCLVRQRR